MARSSSVFMAFPLARSTGLHSSGDPMTIQSSGSSANSAGGAMLISMSSIPPPASPPPASQQQGKTFRDRRQLKQPAMFLASGVEHQDDARRSRRLDTHLLGAFGFRLRPASCFFNDLSELRAKFVSGGSDLVLSQPRRTPGHPPGWQKDQRSEVARRSTSIASRSRNRRHRRGS